MNGAAFLDRDGVINEIVFFPELGLLDSPLNPQQFRLLPGVAEAIGVFNRLGFRVIVVSNQPAIAKGKMTMSLFNRICGKMRKEIEKDGGHLDAEYYCFHHPSAKNIEYRDNCDCRKPKPGLLLKAAKDFGLDFSKCYVIGDSLVDVKAGKAVGCRAVLIGNLKCDTCKLMEKEDIRPDLIVPDVLHAAKIIENMVSKDGNIH